LEATSHSQKKQKPTSQQARLQVCECDDRLHYFFLANWNQSAKDLLIKLNLLLVNAPIFIYDLSWIGC
jgi:hypothetical protein